MISTVVFPPQSATQRALRHEHNMKYDDSANRHPENVVVTLILNPRTRHSGTQHATTHSDYGRQGRGGTASCTTTEDCALRKHCAKLKQPPYPCWTMRPTIRFKHLTANCEHLGFDPLQSTCIQRLDDDYLALPDPAPVAHPPEPPAT